MDSLLNCFNELSDFWFYSALFISSFLENILPPLPGDTVTVFGAYLIGTGRLDFWITYISTTLGSVFGFMIYFFAGRILGRKFFAGEYKYLPDPKNIKKIEQWYHKYGYGIIIANRFLSGLRSIISIFAGVSRLNIWIILLCTTISCLIWNGLLIKLGMLVGENWNVIIEYIKKYNIIVFSLLTLIALIGLFFRIKRK